MPSASLSFVAWTRQGAAAAVATEDSTATPLAAAARLSPRMTINGAILPAVPIRLRGPGDVLGIDPNQVIRTDPRPDTTDFESNCFASVEFDRPDFPWLFTPARANGDRRLRPWLCLVVVERQPGVTVETPAGAPLPILRIAAPAKPDVELPDLKGCWAWAHTQVAAEAPFARPVAAALAGGPELSLSRLVSPRILAPRTEYVACVVPTFDVGRLAGLGEPVSGAELLTPAWLSGKSSPDQVSLPVYFQWSFRTGEEGDFEFIARGLRPGAPAGLGARRIDVSRPGFNAAGAVSTDLQGALKPIQAGAAEAPAPAGFKTNLAAILNTPAAAPAAADPVLAPPIYGRWHAARPTVAPGGSTWLDQLNLEPRWRAVAAFGTRVVQTHQEALMASAWEQAAEIEAANQRLRQLQLAATAGATLHARHFAKFSDEMMLRVTAPAMGQVALGVEASMLDRQAQSRLPLGANGSAMRRIGRHRGALSRRVAAQDAPRAAGQTWVASMMVAPVQTSLAAPPTDRVALPQLPTARLASDSHFGAFFVSPETVAPVFPGEPVLVARRTEIPGFFRDAALKHLAAFFPTATVAPPAAAPVDLSGFKAQMLARLQPGATMPAIAGAAIETGEDVLASGPPRVASTGLETIMAAPRFPTPMYEPLSELSQTLLLPGLDAVASETVVGLQTNRPFVEAYMAGLNHEMARELLWRGFPTDQRGSYFRNFWGQTGADATDVAELTTWRDHPLGGSPGTVAAESFVLLLRSRLLARYPNAVLFMVPAIAGAGGPQPDPNAEAKMPIFSGGLDPDVRFLGFPVTTVAATGADGKAGWYVVIQEHPTEPRFGIDVGAAPAGASHLVVDGPLPGGLAAWATNSAGIAGALRRRPTRVAIHARRLIAPAA